MRHRLRPAKIPAATNGVGWYGAVAILVAYALASFSIISFDSPWYYLLNLTGSLGIVIIGWRKQDFQSVFLNAVWVFITAVAFIHWLLK